MTTPFSFVLQCPRCKGTALLRGEVLVDNWKEDVADGECVGIGVKIDEQHVDIHTLTADDEDDVGSKVRVSVWCSPCDRTSVLHLEMIDDVLRLEWD